MTRLVAVLAAVVTLTTAASADAQAPGTARPGALIDVPYFPQTRLLCGGAALTMVLRYWGASGVVPGDFQPLVDEAAGGITTGRLVDAARARGWQAVAATAPETAPMAAMAQHVRQGRPVVALIEDSPGVTHYVVVVGVTDTDVVLHDPARAPYRVMSHDAFDARWRVSSRWLLLVLPGDDAPGAPGDAPARENAGAAPRGTATAVPRAADAGATAARENATSASPCDALVASGVTAAREDHAMAERILRSAIALCPTTAAGYRELAGLEFVRQRWADSATLASAAVGHDPADTHAWRLLATSRFLAEDRAGALQAWNVTGEPTIDRVVIEGLRRTPQPLVADLAGLQAGQVLTAGRFTRAARRLEDLPSASRSSLTYAPISAGRTTVSALVQERPLVPSGWIGWSAAVVDSALARTVRLDIAAPFSQGDLWQPAFRWPKERRRVGLALALPVPGGRRGILRVEGFDERQTYARAIEDVTQSEATRRRFSVAYSDWISGPVRIEAGAATDRLDGTPYVSVFGALTSRLLRDRVAAHLRAERWQPRSGRVLAHVSFDAIVDWRSTTETDVARWQARAGIARVSADAPLALWAGAGSSLDRTTLLRGRRLVVRHVLTGEVFGRQLVYATVEHQRPVWRSPYGALAVAGFADAARAFDRLDSHEPSRLHVDIGAGLRIVRPGDANQIRLDWGVGVRDGRMRVSAGYVAAWGRR